MKPTVSDTSPEMQQVHFDLMRAIPEWKRLALTFELIQSMRELMLADIRQRFPEADKEELRRRLIARLLSREEVKQVYGFDPAIYD